MEAFQPRLIDFAFQKPNITKAKIYIKCIESLFNQDSLGCPVLISDIGQIKG
jgi:hypothetical protein